MVFHDSSVIWRLLPTFTDEVILREMGQWFSPVSIGQLAGRRAYLHVLLQLGLQPAGHPAHPAVAGERVRLQVAGARDEAGQGPLGDGVREGLSDWFGLLSQGEVSIGERSVGLLKAWKGK